jgi:hypothetical protein
MEARLPPKPRVTTQHRCEVARPRGEVTRSVRGSCASLVGTAAQEEGWDGGTMVVNWSEGPYVS